MRGTFNGTPWLVPLLLLAACQTPAPEPPPAPPPPAADIPAAPVAEAPLRSASTGWSFNRDRCAATAAGRGAGVDVVASDRAIAWSVRGRILAGVRTTRGAPMAFSGASSGTNAAWTVNGARTRNGQLAASLPLSEDAAGQVLLMLGGGTLRLGTGRDAATIRVANAGQAGRTWFECVRKRLLP